MPQPHFVEIRPRQRMAEPRPYIDEPRPHMVEIMPRDSFVTDSRRRKWVRNSTDEFVARRESPGILGRAPPKTVYTNDPRSGMREFLHVKKIGEGGQGRCDLVKRQSDGKLIVYKQMKGRIDITRSKKKDKPLEVAILNDILGPSERIIKLFDYIYKGPTDNCFFLEYCSYGDLYNLIEGYHKNLGIEIPESFVWHTYMQLAEALAFIQEGVTRRVTPDKSIRWTTPSRDHRPIVHRDIKPDNVFIRPGKTRNHYPELVLADFGLATTERRSCEGEDDHCGTMAYQGPELPLHSRDGDMWAIGACIHHMTMGIPPIKPCPKDRTRKYWAFKPEARKVLDITKRGFSRQLDDAMYKVLRKHPSDRLRGKALVEYLEKACAKWNGARVKLKPWSEQVR